MSLFLITVVLLLSWLFTSIFVLEPMDLMQWLHIPRWLCLSIILLIVSWCLGD
ncbi:MULTISPECIES: hypothetical protein [unclassified Okeania]|uniref:hypothetical protein n=1 Tax=unclassified Okeania TaxID=2634635 RepID=UPI0013C25822|nr:MULTISPECIES: hypothetical protein [unclassified Okeania]NEN88317.1 hypothetical protein [Okeania sp. SIO3H1]NET25061.1 hypothetical protein [Okeania sp. SIO1I7]NET41367.1 hypothetical protein [Okeania sp. SIO2B3]